jgi:hypothetical protein
MITVRAAKDKTGVHRSFNPTPFVIMPFTMGRKKVIGMM